MPVLIRQDTLEALSLPTTTRISHLTDGAVTTHALADRSSGSDGVTVLPDTFVIELYPGAAVAGEESVIGPERVATVQEFLRSARADAAFLNFQRLNRAEVADLLVESFPSDTTEAGGLADKMTIRLRQVSFQTTQTVDLGLRPRKGKSRPAGESDSEDTQEGGTGTTRRKSIAAGGLDSITGLFSGTIGTL